MIPENYWAWPLIEKLRDTLTTLTPGDRRRAAEEMERMVTEWEAAIEYCEKTAQGIDNLDCNCPDMVGMMEIGKMHAFRTVAEYLKKHKTDKGTA